MSIWIYIFHKWAEAEFETGQSAFISGLPHTLKERHLLFFLFAISLEMIQPMMIHGHTISPGSSTTTKQADRHNADAKYADGSMRDFVHKFVDFQKVGG